jgi:hypothetical protein
MMFKDIIEFAKYLWDDISPAQLTWLRVAYGMPLTGAERGTWRKYSETAIFARYRPRVYAESLLLKGRQGGGSSRIGVTVALYESIVVPRVIEPGTRLAVLFVAPTLRQSCFDQTVEKLRATPELVALIETDAASSGGEVRLTNGIDLVNISANPRHARGRAAVLCVVDEASFIRTDSAFEMNLPELLESLRPSLIVHSGKLLLISSPSGKEGPLYEAWQNRADNLDTFVFRCPSQVFNPSIDPKLLAREEKRGKSYYRREYLAEFVESANPFLNPEALEASILRGVTELPPDPSDVVVCAGIDLADKVDSCALGISAVRTVDGKRKVVLLFAKEWRPTKSGHNVLGILAEMGELCKKYRVSRAHGDQKSMSVAENVMARYSVSFSRVISAGAGSEQTFRTFAALMNDDSIRLVENPTVIEQARRLEAKTTDGNRFLVEGRRGSRDDVIVSVVLSAAMCADNLNAIAPRVASLFPGLIDDERGWHPLDGNGNIVEGDQWQRQTRIPSFARPRV